MVLFTKNVDKWADYYRGNKNIEVRPVGNEFAGYALALRRPRRVAEPGVVTQALAIGRPCYLLCLPGHLEQQFNEDYYFKYFTGVTKPSMQGIGAWAATIKTTDDRYAAAGAEDPRLAPQVRGADAEDGDPHPPPHDGADHRRVRRAPLRREGERIE